MGRGPDHGFGRGVRVLFAGRISETAGMIGGTLAVLVYVVIGGFLAVAWTDFIQMIVLVIGLGVIAFFANDLAGGTDKVMALASSRTCGTVFPQAGGLTEWATFVAAITMMLGSIPSRTSSSA